MVCNNVFAISRASNPVFHACTKTLNIEVDFHFVHEKVRHKQLLIKYVPSKHQVAGILTKPLSISRFHFLTSKLKLSVLPTSISGGVSSHSSNSGHFTSAAQAVTSKTGAASTTEAK